MGGEIKLTEKEKWAAYFCEVLRHAGYGDASKYLHKLAHKKHFPMAEFPVWIETPNVYKGISEAEKEIKKFPKKTITKRSMKPTLMEDIHGDKGEEDV
jgi:hypothetical protein